MAESHKFSTEAKALEVFPELDIRTQRGTGNVVVYNSKTDEFATVKKGQYIVKIADRYEVHDEEPEKAKPAEAPKESRKDAQKAGDQDATAKAVEGNQTVVPEELGTAPGPESK